MIMELAMKNKNMESRIQECEAELEKNKFEKRANGRIQKERVLFRDRIIAFGALLYVGLFAIMFVVVVSK